MIEPTNSILFYLTILFGLQVTIFSDSTSININTNTNTIDLLYTDLQIYEEDTVFKDAIIGYLDSLKTIDSDYPEFDLITSNKIYEDGKYDYKISLKYKSLNSLKKYFKIDIDSNKIYVFYADIINVNSIDSLNTNNDFGEYMIFNKTTSDQYKIRYNWETEKIQMNGISLTNYK